MPKIADVIRTVVKSGPLTKAELQKRVAKEKIDGEEIGSGNAVREIDILWNFSLFENAATKEVMLKHHVERAIKKTKRS